ncbi:oligosaccharide flippase family protein [Thiotrichales bacterium 19S11-10]|nr:oligosaccharide flippase family protein [Thiotrichales bacterium 19S11-10]
MVDIYSIRVRFIFSFGANITRAGLSFLATLLIARTLAPEIYGQLAYLMATFLALVQLLDNGVGAAFYTFISKKFYAIETHIIYYIWLACQFVAVCLFILLLAPESILLIIWHESSSGMLMLAFSSFFIQQAIWWSIVQIGEAQRKTLFAQTGVIIVNLCYFLTIFAQALLNKLSITSVFLSMIYIYGLASIIFGMIFFSSKQNFEWSGLKEIKKEVLRYFHYCKPLIFQAVVTFFHTFLINWMLRTFSGSTEQGYYQISYQFTAVSLLATTSILRIFWKEIAELSSENQTDRMEKLFSKVIDLGVLFGSIISGFLICWSKEIIELFLGSAYLPATLVLSLMFLFPVHQSMGQILGTAYQATSKTRIYALLSIFLMITGIIIVYFFLAPKNAFVPGLNLGAFGLAIEMVVMNILGANLMYFVFCRLYGWQFLWLRQIIFIVGFLLISYIIKLIATNISLTLSLQGHFAFIIAGFLYCLVLLMLYLSYRQFRKFTN